MERIQCWRLRCSDKTSWAPAASVHHGHRAQAVAEVREVQLVAERIGVDRIAGRVDGDAPVAVVADQEDQRRGLRPARHVGLVLHAGLPRDRRAGHAGRGV